METSRGGNLLHTKAEKPLRIFISYGHPEAEICLRIRDVLLSRGHKVWFDTFEIKAGDDVEVDFDTGVITDNTTGKTYQAEPFPPFIQGIIKDGGLINHVTK